MTQKLKNILLDQNKKEINDLYFSLLELRKGLIDLTVDKMALIQGAEKDLIDLAETANHMEANALIKQQMEELAENNKKHTQKNESKIQNLINKVNRVYN